MIKRTYFVSAKIAHNNNTGEYSYYNGVMNTKSWLPGKADDLVDSARLMVLGDIIHLVDGRSVHTDDVELLALNKL